VGAVSSPAPLRDPRMAHRSCRTRPARGPCRCGLAVRAVPFARRRQLEPALRPRQRPGCYAGVPIDQLRTGGAVGFGDPCTDGLLQGRGVGELQLPLEPVARGGGPAIGVWLASW
jgi:hypothetical protein